MTPSDPDLPVERLRSRLSPETTLRAREPLARKTTLRVGGVADIYVEPAHEEDLSRVLKWCREEGQPVFFLGRGSNLLIRDGGIRGVVVHLSPTAFGGIAVTGNRLDCGAGARLKAVAAEARRHSLGGLEFLEGIPGSLGGALRMNAGAMGGDVFSRMERLRYMDPDGSLHEVEASRVGAIYRACPFLSGRVALSAVLVGIPASKAEIEARMRTLSQKRWDSQPASSSAGCMFKNPAEIPAGRLIDELGLKGRSVGGVRISVVHGNFFENDGSATAAQVLELIEWVRSQAREKRGIELETEVQIVGE